MEGRLRVNFTPSTSSICVKISLLVFLSRSLLMTIMWVVCI